MAASSFVTGKSGSHMTPDSRPFGESVVVEIGANRQSCDPSVSLMLKLILEVVIGVADCSRRKDRRGPRRNSSPQGSG